MPKTSRPAPVFPLFHQLPFRDQVRAAAWLARLMIRSGIDLGEHRELTMSERIAELLDDSDLRDPRGELGEREYERLCTRLEAAVALGIAIGLRVQPDVYLHGVADDRASDDEDGAR